MNKVSAIDSSRLTVTYRPLGELIPDPRNARTHPKRWVGSVSNRGGSHPVGGGLRPAEVGHALFAQQG